MKKFYVSIGVLTLLLSACKEEESKTVTTIVENDTVAPVAETSSVAVDSAAMMKAWETYVTPGEPHKFFAKEVGTWDEEATFYMTPNDPNPMKAKMTAEISMILGGRYQQSRHTGAVMGEPFEGVATMGYDNAQKKIVSTWIDNMGTGIMHVTGDFDPNSKSIELTGEVTDPMTGKKKPYREVYTIVDDNTRHLEMYDVTPDGKEYKSMEMMLKRKDNKGLG